MTDLSHIPAPGKVLIVGLGNPGKEYRYTRHNAGFLILDALANTINCKLSTLKFNSILGTCSLYGRELILLKPLTFMNLSGNAVKPALKAYGVPPQNLLVIHDEIDLPLGKLKFKWDGGSSHKGILSIVNSLGSRDFSRLRVGINTPSSRGVPRKEYVLQEFSPDELEILEEVSKHAVEGIIIFLEEGLAKAMTEINRLDLGIPF